MNNVILQPYVTVPAASRLTGMSVRKLRRGCEDGSIPHIRSNGRYYVDLPALWDKMDAEQRATNETWFDTKELI